MLVTITIIGILSSMVYGALLLARESGREAATKATIAKLNTIIMRRYESYMTRRVPINTAGLTPKQAAEIRLIAIRQLMRMEMPDRWSDIINPALSSDPNKPDPNGYVTIQDSTKTVSRTLARPALSRLYAQLYIQKVFGKTAPSPDYSCAECLYMLVSMGSPEVMDQFNQSEIGDKDGDGMPEFLDGWDRPIMFLRCAPGFSASSDIQVANATDHHDPFDTRRVDSLAYHLIPLIFSAGPDGKYAINSEYHYQFVGDPFGTFGFPCTDGSGSADPTRVGLPSDVSDEASVVSNCHDNITNHHIEAR
jgi:hypothetical protein